MGLFDEFFKSPEQSRNERAEREGVREAHEGSDILGDTVDELTYGREYVDLKTAAREGTREALRNDSVVDNISNDIYDEFAHPREYVDRKRYYRDRTSDRSYSEESQNYPSGSYSYSPSSGSSSADSSSTDPSSDPTEGPAFVVVGLIVVGLLIWMFSCVANSIRQAANKPYKPTSLPTAMTSGPSGTSFYTGEGDPLAFQAYNDGNYFLKQSKYDQAVSYLTEAIRRSPNYWEAYLSRGAAYSYQDRHDLALRDYDAVVRLQPNNPRAYLARGLSEHRSGQQQHAVNDLTQGLKLNPTESLDVYYRARGTAYLMLNQFQPAIEDFNETLRLKPNDSFSMGNRGAAYARSGEHQLALQDYTRALTLDPNNAGLHFSRGLTYQALDQYESAIQDYDEAIRLDPNLTQAQTARNSVRARVSATTANEDATSATSDSVVTNTEEEQASVFNVHFLNTGLWFVTVVPAGVGTISETNQQLEMTKISSGNGYMGLASKCKVAGDFDVQVDYKLLNWPGQNFHTVRLMASDLPDGGTGFPGVSRNSYADENYQFRSQLGVAGLVSVPTSDTSGTIGLRRIGPTLSGYGPHGTIGSAPAPAGPTGFTIDFATPSTTAPGNVAIAFDNFKINAGTVVCPQREKRVPLSPACWVAALSLEQ